MPKRPDIGAQARPPARGAATFAPDASQRWEDRFTRVTFHCPVEALDAVEKEMARTGRSKSRVIGEALLAHFRSTDTDTDTVS